MPTQAPLSNPPTFSPAPKLPTWFGVGGGTTRFATPATITQLSALLAIDPHLKVLGDGANLLVDDAGIDDLVVRLSAPDFTHVSTNLKTGEVHAGAGTHLFALINRTVKEGLAGLETLAGIPATLGGAIVMNAGGAFGQIADVIERVHALDRSGNTITLGKRDIHFNYRKSGLNHLIITSADLKLTPSDPAQLAKRKQEINDYKLRTQPMSANSAGCCFKNPTLPHDLTHNGEPLGKKGQRVSAGMLIDRASLKGLTHNTAQVSEQHANFLVTPDKHSGKARDIIDLMTIVETRVKATFGVTLEREVVVWQRKSS